MIRASVPIKPSPSGSAANTSSADWDDDADVDMSEDLLQSMEAAG